MGKVLGSEFVKGICCAHDWRVTAELETVTKEVCDECSAICVRERVGGQIIEYDRTAGFERKERDLDGPPPERRPNGHRRDRDRGSYTR